MDAVKTDESLTLVHTVKRNKLKLDKDVSMSLLELELELDGILKKGNF